MQHGCYEASLRSPLTANGAKHSSRPGRSSAACYSTGADQHYGPRAYAASRPLGPMRHRSYAASVPLQDWPPGPMHHGRYAARGPPGRRSNTALCSTIRTQHHGLRPFTGEALAWTRSKHSSSWVHLRGRSVPRGCCRGHRRSHRRALSLCFAAEAFEPAAAGAASEQADSSLAVSTSAATGHCPERSSS